MECVGKRVLVEWDERTPMTEEEVEAAFAELNSRKDGS
jgi:hypothetical protein